MKQQQGVTLIELLVVIAIIGIIIVPILTLMTGTFTNTVSQGNESRNIYYAQQVIEEARVLKFPNNLAGASIYGTCSPTGCTAINFSSTSLPTLSGTEALYKIELKSLVNVTNDVTRNSGLTAAFYEAKVVVEVLGDASQTVELVTVVNRQ